jgi:hypothetical protein
VHVPHAPVDWQYGFALVGQGFGAIVALSPSHTTHTLLLEHTGFGLAQVADTTHAPQLPAFGPVVTQIPFAAVGHARVAADPKLPLHPAQMSCVGVVSQVGVAPVHAVRLDDVHVPHVFFVASQRGWAAAQSTSTTQPPHWFPPMIANVQTAPENPTPAAGVADPTAPAVAPYAVPAYIGSAVVVVPLAPPAAVAGHAPLAARTNT